MSEDASTFPTVSQLLPVRYQQVDKAINDPKSGAYPKGLRKGKKQREQAADQDTDGPDDGIINGSEQYGSHHDIPPFNDGHSILFSADVSTAPVGFLLAPSIRGMAENFRGGVPNVRVISASIAAWFTARVDGKA